MLIVFAGSFAACFLTLTLFFELRDEKRSNQAIRRVMGC